MNKNWGKKTFSVLMTLLMACSLMTGVFAAQPESVSATPSESTSSEASVVAPEGGSVSQKGESGSSVSGSVPESAPSSTSTADESASAPSSSIPEESSSAASEEAPASSEAPAPSEAAPASEAPATPPEVMAAPAAAEEPAVAPQESVGPQRAPMQQNVITVDPDPAKSYIKIGGTTITDGTNIDLTSTADFELNYEWTLDVDAIQGGGLLNGDTSIVGQIPGRLPLTDLPTKSLIAEIEIPKGSGNKVHIGNVTFVRQSGPDSNFNIVLTYNDKAIQISTMNNVEGKIKLGGQLVVDYSVKPGDQYEFKVGDTSVIITINKVKEISKKFLKWEGDLLRNGDEDDTYQKAIWQVDVYPDGTEMLDGKITDTIFNAALQFPATWDGSTEVKVYPITAKPASVGAEPTLGAALTYGTHYTVNRVSAQKVEIVLVSTSATKEEWKKNYRIEIATYVPTPVDALNPAVHKCKNTASYETAGGIMSDDAYTKWNASGWKRAAKKRYEGTWRAPAFASRSLTPSKYYYEWTMFISSNGHDFGTVTLLDSMSAGLGLAKNPGNIFIYDSNNSEDVRYAFELYETDAHGKKTTGINMIGSTSTHQVVFNPTNQIDPTMGVHFAIPNVDMNGKYYSLTVRTYVMDPDLIATTRVKNTIGWITDGDFQYEFSANDDGSFGDVVKATLNKGARKSIVPNTPNSATGKMSWIFYFNANGQKAHNLVLEDVFGETSYTDQTNDGDLKDPNRPSDVKMNLDVNSVEVAIGRWEGQAFSGTYNGVPGQTGIMQKDTHYKLKYRTGKTNYETGFMVEILNPNPLEPYDNYNNYQIFVRYDTTYDLGSQPSYSYRNYVQSVFNAGTAAGPEDYKQAAVIQTPAKAELHIEKDGRFYYKGDKPTVDWEVTINDPVQPLGDGVRVVDVLGVSGFRNMDKPDLTDPNAIEIYPVNSGGTRGTKLTLGTDYTVTADDPDVTYDCSEYAFYIDFKIPINQTYVICYSSTVKDTPASDKIHNEARIGYTSQKCSVKADKEFVRSANKGLSKTGAVSASNDSIYEWKLVVDSDVAGIDLAEIVLNDVMSRGHYYVKDSLQVTAFSEAGAAREADLSAASNWTELYEEFGTPNWNSKLTVTMDPTLILKVADKEKLTFTYKTMLDSDLLVRDSNGEYTISNSATLVAKGVITYTSTKDTSSSLSGNMSGSGRLVKLYIEKMGKGSPNFPLQDAEFYFYEMESGKLKRVAESETYETGANGLTGKYIEVQVGKTYYIEEAVAPVGYDPAADNVGTYTTTDGRTIKARAFTVTSSMGKTEVVDSAGDKMMENNKPVEAEKITFVNEKLTNKLTVTKVDANDNTVTLSGAAFELYIDGNPNGTFDAPGTLVGTRKTTGGTGVVEWTKLAGGDYRLIEVSAPTGYTIKDTQKDFTLPDTASGTTRQETFTWENDPVLHSAEVVKIDAETGAKLAGATFELKNTTTGKSLGKKTTGGDGKAVWTDLTPGSYEFTEISAPAGYVTPTGAAAKKAFTIALGNTSTTQSIAWTNDKTPVLSSYLVEVLKTDAVTGQILPGATFELFKDGVSLGSIVTNASGKALWTALEEGNYKVVETAAPAGYVTPTGTDAERSFTLNASTPESAQRITWPNTPETTPVLYSLEVLKVDSDTGANLSGAVFRLLDASGANQGRKTTGSNGKATWTGLAAGTYTLEELSAPKGYDLPGKTTTTVQVPASDSTSTAVKVTVKNTKTPSSSSTPPPSSSTPPPSSSTPTRRTPPPVTTTPPAPTPPDTGVAGAPPAPTPPAATATTPPAATPPAEDAPVEVEPATVSSSPLEQIMNGTVPLGGFGEAKAWSLLNLMMSIVSLFAAIALGISAFKRKKREEQEQAEKEQNYDEYAQDEEPEQEDSVDRKRLMGLRIPAILTGFLPGILFLILEDIRLPMTWITRWTPIIGAFFIINMVFVITHFIIKKRVDKQDNGEDTDEANVAYS